MATKTYYVETYLDCSIKDAWSFFSTAENLAKITTFPKVTILSNPKTEAGNTIEMELHFLFFKQSWRSTITEVKQESYFIDEGTRIPFPFKSWKHTHAFEKKEKGTLMTDTVEYAAYVPNSFVQAFLKQMFASRKKELQKFFRK